MTVAVAAEKVCLPLAIKLRPPNRLGKPPGALCLFVAQRLFRVPIKQLRQSLQSSVAFLRRQWRPGGLDHITRKALYDARSSGIGAGERPSFNPGQGNEAAEQPERARHPALFCARAHLLECQLGATAGVCHGGA